MTTTPTRKCIHLDGCDQPATQIVSAQPMCDSHGHQERIETSRHDARIRAWAASPEGRAEAAAERALEARVS